MVGKGKRGRLISTKMRRSSIAHPAAAFPKTRRPQLLRSDPTYLDEEATQLVCRRGKAAYRAFTPPALLNGAYVRHRG